MTKQRRKEVKKVKKMMKMTLISLKIRIQNKNNKIKLRKN